MVSNSEHMIFPVNSYKDKKIERPIPRAINRIKINNPFHKAHAIGAALASSTGMHSEEIITHEFWLNYTIFES
ncbi:hypothetical protein AYI68_g4213 [Smittium mucronatum]|uniref:Uncharacterized protein n=1 Tax=Smittium mucronatum TaxID=133383 RepID=A0A1R0GXR0_9FUNG|nr:hypothetical protein AYI68_g4213 [Smittium mucronatum]